MAIRAPLAVVVPAWKPQFLRQALASIAAQEGDFDCYVFDDAAPRLVQDIAARYPQFVYHRFETNLGGRSLVAHWNRCLAGLDHEWIWLFSDDDVMQPGSVRAVLDTIAAEPRARVLQLPVDSVSADLDHLYWRSVPPTHESATEFLQARLAGQRLSCLPDHVFHWPSLRRIAGGLVDLPLAWNADDASWLLLGKEAGLQSVPGAKVLWRQSADNISGNVGQRWDKLRADLRFIDFLDKAELPDLGWRRGLPGWLYRRLTDLYQVGFRDLAVAARVLPAAWWPVLVAAVLRSTWHNAKRHVRREQPA